MHGIRVRCAAHQHHQRCRASGAGIQRDGSTPMLQEDAQASADIKQRPAMNTHRIALYPGDGIGPEVTDAAVAVLTATALRSKHFDVDFEYFDWGMPHYDKHGRVAPDDFLATLQRFNAIYLGAVG